MATGKKTSIRHLASAVAIIAIILIGLALAGMLSYRQGLFGLLCAGALFVMSHDKLRGFSFTAWVLVCVGFALAWPQSLHQWGGFELPLLIVPLTHLNQLRNSV